MSKPVIIYHANCLDGVAAAWCFYDVHADHLEYVPGYYQGLTKEELKKYQDRAIVLVDFSLKKEAVEQLLDQGNSVSLVDHHVTAIDELKKIEHRSFSMANSSISNSGAVLAWKFTHEEGEPIPQLLLHIEDRDLWNFNLPKTEEITAACYLMMSTPDKFDEIVNTPLLELQAIGKILIKQRKKTVKSLLKHTRYVAIDGIVCPVVNSPGEFSSEVGNELSKEKPLGITYFDSNENRIFSLRSSKDNPYAINVGKFASKFGGGGHRHAAGFKVSRDHWLAKI